MKSTIDHSKIIVLEKATGNKKSVTKEAFKMLNTINPKSYEFIAEDKDGTFKSENTKINPNPVLTQAEHIKKYGTISQPTPNKSNVIEEIPLITKPKIATKVEVVKDEVKDNINSDSVDVVAEKAIEETVIHTDSEEKRKNKKNSQ